MKKVFFLLLLLMSFGAAAVDNAVAKLCVWAHQLRWMLSGYTHQNLNHSLWRNCLIKGQGQALPTGNSLKTHIKQYPDFIRDRWINAKF